MRRLTVAASIAFIFAFLCELSSGYVEEEREGDHEHVDNWAVIVSTSRFWHNYRHEANALGVYRWCRRLGIPDSRIVLMLAEDAGCNARNSIPGNVFPEVGSRLVELLGGDPVAEAEAVGAADPREAAGRSAAVQVDYRGLAVNVDSFTRVLSGRHAPGTPLSKQLSSDANSNVLIYLTGHGGDEFLKFHDADEMGALDLAWAIDEMQLKRRYRRLLVVSDTCQAGTLSNQLRAPGVIAIASSHLGESSYSSGADHEIGVSLLDRFTEATMRFFDRATISRGRGASAGAGMSLGSATLGMLLGSIDPRAIRSRPHTRDDLWTRTTNVSAAEILLSDFFGARDKSTSAL